MIVVDDDVWFCDNVLTGIGEVIPVVDADLKRTAAKVTDRAKELCVQKSV